MGLMSITGRGTKFLFYVNDGDKLHPIKYNFKRANSTISIHSTVKMKDIRFYFGAIQGADRTKKRRLSVR